MCFYFFFTFLSNVTGEAWYPRW